jgi:hypothetical protein
MNLNCKFLTNVIKEVKRFTYKKQIVNSHIQVKTTQNIIKSEAEKS